MGSIWHISVLCDIFVFGHIVDMTCALNGTYLLGTLPGTSASSYTTHRNVWCTVLWSVCSSCSRLLSHSTWGTTVYFKGPRYGSTNSSFSCTCTCKSYVKVDIHVTYIDFWEANQSMRRKPPCASERKYKNYSYHTVPAGLECVVYLTVSFTVHVRNVMVGENVLLF